MKILFVCTGNICRSVIAESLFAKQAKAKKVKAQAMSAGVGAFPGSPPPTEIVEILKREGQEVSAHTSTPLMPQALQQADLVLTMTGRQRDAIVKKLPQMEKKVVVLKEYVGLKGDVVDPMGGKAEVYEAVFEEVKDAIEKLVEML